MVEDHEFMMVLKDHEKPSKSWKRESCKSVSEDRVGIGEPSSPAAAAIQLWGMRKSYHCVCTILSSPLHREPSRKGEHIGPKITG